MIAWVIVAMNFLMMISRFIDSRPELQVFLTDLHKTHFVTQEMYIFFFYLNLTLFALTGAAVSIIIALSSINLKSLLLRDILKNKKFEQLIVSLILNIFLLMIMQSVHSQYIHSIPLLYRFIVFSLLMLLSVISLFLFLLLLYSIPGIVDPIRLFERTCSKLPISFHPLFKKSQDFWKEMPSYHSLDYLTGITVDVVPFIGLNNVLSEISSLYYDILINSDYTKIREATIILSTKLKGFAKKNFDGLYCKVLIPVFFAMLKQTFRHNIDKHTIIIMFDEAAKLLLSLRGKELEETFRHSSRLFENAYEEMFHTYQGRIKNMEELNRLIKPYFLCLNSNEPNMSVQYHFNLGRLYNKLFSIFGCKYLASALDIYPDKIKNFIIFTDSPNEVETVLDSVSGLFEIEEFINCPFNEIDNILMWFLTIMRKTQEHLANIEERTDVIVRKYNLIAGFIDTQIDINRDSLPNSNLEDFEFIQSIEQGIRRISI